ncbi:NAD(P)-dependent oxidoreductase [Candidatus Bathyarchaeota archaeon]|nr:NAD(P)-dependent oxidoreductase [Candidatus Bathyarchaeota archaeon]
MKILLTGGAGYIGSILTRELMKAGHDVRIFDNLTYGKESIPDGVELVNGDLMNILKVARAVRGTDAIIHLAAIVGDPSGKLIPDETLAVNYFGTRNLAEAGKHFGINRFVLASTCSVYGFREGICTEATEPNPISNYAETKVLAERALASIPDVNPVILRLGTVYGLSPRMRFDLVANLLIAKALWEGKITVYGKGKQFRPFVHVRDVADAFRMGLEVAPGTYNVGSDEQNHSVRELAEIIATNVRAAEVVFVEQKEDNRSYRASFEKFVALGFAPRFKIPDAVREIKDAKNKGVLKDYTEARYSNFETLKNSFKPGR